MLKYYVKASDLLERLCTDKDGVVSLEYVIVGACVCAVVIALFGTNQTGANTLNGALTTGFTSIANSFKAL